jgi:hypothetical protein
MQGAGVPAAAAAAAAGDDEEEDVVLMIDTGRYFPMYDVSEQAGYVRFGGCMPLSPTPTPDREQEAHTCLAAPLSSSMSLSSSSSSSTSSSSRPAISDAWMADVSEFLLPGLL